MDLQALYARQIAERALTPDPAQQRVVTKLDNLRSRLITARVTPGFALPRWLGPLAQPRRAPAPRGLYLWGGVGRGKTLLMDLFYQSLPLRQRQRSHFHRFMHDVHAQLQSFQRSMQPLELVAESIARDARVLCFDELYVADIADAMILGGLFTGLFKRGVTLVATSNVAPRDLYEDGLQRQRFIPAIELIEQHVEVVHVDGAVDYRLRRLTQAGTYLPAGLADTTGRLERLFDELSDQAGDRDRAAELAGSIAIEGRAIPVIREGGGVVWFAFGAICAGPRSQEDYIEIARNYQSVIVANVPVFDEVLENEARRFIALVDELYDRNVNLIVSAAAAPAELYRGELLAAPFQRTVSRLIEMQSEDYLARQHKA